MHAKQRYSLSRTNLSKVVCLQKIKETNVLNMFEETLNSSKIWLLQCYASFISRKDYVNSYRNKNSNTLSILELLLNQQQLVFQF